MARGYHHRTGQSITANDAVRYGRHILRIDVTPRNSGA